jgi:CxxC motif-containing protein (DUF1111 family)
MKNTTMAIALALLAGQTVADVEHGKKLHDASCVKCHDSGVYTREDRFVANKDALKTQVQRCNVNLGTQWFDEDVSDVTDFLNATYYKFP